MTLHAVAFAAGAGLLQLQAELPSLGWAWVALPAALLGLRFPTGVPALAFVSGFFWAAFLAHERMDDWLAPALEARDLQVVGVVSSLPSAGARSVRFDFDIEQPLDGERLPPRIQLTWYRSGLAEEGAAPLAAMVHPGERWRFTVRLRRPHGSANPHGFDYAAWLLERGIGATGYVRAARHQPAARPA